MGGDPRAKKDLAKSIPQYIELADMHVEDAKLHLRSWKDTKMYIERHILPKWGKTRLTDIDNRAVAQWLGEKRAEGLAPATVEKIRVIFGRSFELGLRWSIPGCEKNPTRGIPRKPLNNARERFLTAEEAARLRQAAAASNGIDLFTVGKVLGHACYQSTQRYSHLANETLLAAVEKGAAKQALP